MDPNWLRSERKRRGVSLNDLAKNLGVIPSYLSHMEAGRKKMPQTLMDAYRRELDLVGARQSDVAGGLIRHITSFKPYERGRWRRAADGVSRMLRHRASTESEHRTLHGEVEGRADLAGFLQEAFGFKDKAILRAETIFVWSSAEHYLKNVVGKRLHSIIQKSIDYKVPFSQYISASPTRQTYDDDVVWLVKMALRYAQYGDLVKFDTIGDVNFGRFDMDFMSVANHVATIRFSAGNPLAQRAGVLVEKQPDIEALHQYIKRMENHRDFCVSVYVGERGLQRFFDAYSAVDHELGDKCIFQQFLGSFTMPNEAYRPDTAWWKRYESVKDCDVVRLADARQRSTSNLRKRLETNNVRQICCIETLQMWAKTGRRPDIRSRVVIEPQADRLARLDYVIYLLRQYDRFSIGLLEGESHPEFGWVPPSNVSESPAEPGRSLAWLVQGSAKVVFESAIHANDDRKKRKWSELQCIVSNSTLQAEFSSLFERIWDSLSPPRKSRHDVIAFFESLKLLVPKQSGAM